MGDSAPTHWFVAVDLLTFFVYNGNLPLDGVAFSRLD